jgi:membrane protein
MIKKVVNFIQSDIWRIRAKDLAPKKSYLIKPLRVVLLALRGFDEDKCMLRASALTFFSLLSIVPVAAMVFGIAKGFGFGKVLEQRILESSAGQEEVVNYIITFANSLLENTKGGLIAGIGVVILFWTVIKVLGNIEKSFNDIWGIKKARSIGRKIIDYLAVMFICPITVIMAFSIKAAIVQQLPTLTFLGPISIFLLKLAPFFMLWAAFTFIYIFMPNTKVNFKSGLLGGVIGGTVYVVVVNIYFIFQIGAAKYNAIYGSFAALPLFLVLLQISWLVVLFGAEISFAHQNVDMYEFEPDCAKASQSFKRLLSLRIVQEVVHRFSADKNPLTAAQLGHVLEAPVRLVRQVIFELVDSGVLSEVKTQEEKESAYQPAHDISTLTIKGVIDALEQRGVNDIPIAQTKELEALTQSLSSFGDTLNKSTANKLLKDV